MRVTLALLVLAVATAMVSANLMKLPSGETVCACTLNYAPVCASDGRTYENECMFGCAKERAGTRGTEMKILRDGGCSAGAL